MKEQKKKYCSIWENITEMDCGGEIGILFCESEKKGLKILTSCGGTS